MEDRKYVVTVMPHYGDVNPESAKSFWCFATNRQERYDHASYDAGNSLLAHTFNQCWCFALNLRRQRTVTHFAMLHADIVPNNWWLDVLLDEIERTGADMLSAIVPIKSRDGVTSTAIGDPRDSFQRRRLTMREVMKLPKTFDVADCGFPDRALFVNTGCWICDFRKPWVEKIWFQIQDRITKNEEGLFVPEVAPEDWDFSRRVAEMGGKVMATRKVKLSHFGPRGHRNDHAWGKQLDHTAAGQPLPVLVK